LQSRGKSGGILSGIKEYRFDVLNFSMGVFHLREVILKKIKKVKAWMLVVVYGAAQEEDKDIFFKLSYHLL
jgi:hypothetical protein